MIIKKGKQLITGGNHWKFKGLEINSVEKDSDSFLFLNNHGWLN